MERRQTEGLTQREQGRFARYEAMIDDGTIRDYSQRLVVDGKDTHIMELALYLREQYRQTQEQKYKTYFNIVRQHWEIAFNAKDEEQTEEDEEDAEDEEEFTPFPYTLD